MERLGKLIEWNDERGYGFIAPLADATDAGKLFFHIRDYRQMGRRPEPGELVKYLPQRQADGRWRALRVTRPATLAQRARFRTAKPRHTSLETLVLGLALAAYATLASWGWMRQRLPATAVYALLALNLVTLAAYWRDKRAAQRNAWRTPESTLHLLELLGGWPGAWLAQRWLHHKSSKTSYRAAYIAMVLLNLAALSIWLGWHRPQ